MSEKKQSSEGFFSGAIAEFVIGGVIKKLKPLIVRAKPKFLKYLDGEEEDGKNTGERIIVIMLTKNKKDAIVQVSKKANTQVKYRPGTKPEAMFSVDEWAEKLVRGEF